MNTGRRHVESKKCCLTCTCSSLQGLSAVKFLSQQCSPHAFQYPDHQKEVVPPWNVLHTLGPKSTAPHFFRHEVCLAVAQKWQRPTKDHRQSCNCPLQEPPYESRGIHGLSWRKIWASNQLGKWWYTSYTHSAPILQLSSFARFLDFFSFMFLLCFHLSFPITPQLFAS